MPKAIEPPSPERIGLKSAVREAAAYFGDLYANSPVENLLLEEVEETEDGKFWLITLGYDQKCPPSRYSRLVGSPEVTRAYKTFRIEADTGKVVSMKMRKVD